MRSPGFKHSRARLRNGRARRFLLRSVPIPAPVIGMPSVSDLPESLAAPRMEFATRGAGRMAFYADTSGSGRPLVLLHSVNAAPSAREMKPLFEHYRGRRPVYAPELPGFGHSDRPDILYTPELYAEVLGGFLATVGDAGADVVALSLGAEFAARLALQNPDAVRSLALLSPTGMSVRRPPSGETSVRIRRFLRVPVLGSALFSLVRSRPSIRHFLGLSFAGKAAPEMIEHAWRTARRPGASHAPFCFLSGILFTPDAFESLYLPLTKPALVIYDRDPNVRFDRLGELLAQSNWRARRIAPTRGLAHWEQPAATVAALDAFWASIDG